MGWSSTLASLVLCLAGSPRQALAYTCQLLTQDDTTVQALLGVNCSVTDFKCDCNSSFVNGLFWLFLDDGISKEMNRTGVCKPGEWFITDSSGRCVALFNNSMVFPEPQKCPPGFYCAGKLEPPRSCSSGDHCPLGSPEVGRRCSKGCYCPIPAGGEQLCPDGASCHQGSSSPRACKSGRYCMSGTSCSAAQEGACPKGHYCPFGSKEPTPCHMLAFCPPGSKSEDMYVVVGFFMLMIVSLTFAGAKYYQRLIQCGLGVCFVCACVVAVMWWVDEAIAGFLSLVFGSVAMNWALLRVGTCPPIVARLVAAATACVALAALWMVNPPWSIFMMGLVFCSVLGWLMSRQRFGMVLAGRLLLLLSFGFLFAAYAQVDEVFIFWVGIFLLLTILGLLTSWAFEQRRQHRRLALPFLTRWANAAADGRDLLFTDPFAQSQAQGSREWPLATEVSDPTADTSWGASLRSPRLSRGSGSTTTPGGSERKAGVSFRLEDLSFDLPDGKRLLQDIGLSIDAGRRVAVMGPSGSGKTTLLAVLSGRASYGRVCGQLKVGGRPSDDLIFLQNVTGFVPQDDVLIGELTVEENIRFQATLRLPAGVTSEEADSCVARVAKDLNLTELLHSRVGTPERRGVSGGQRKRVSIAMELVSQPLLLFADEPTSGLDSTTSHEVVRCLNGAAGRLGSTVVAVIHQPRYETLQLFDDLILLGFGGCLVYAGPTGAAVEHFRIRLHVTFPQNTNPADILLDAIQPPNASPEVCASAWKSCAALAPDAEAKPAPRDLFYRPRQPFFQAVLIYTDRSILQLFRKCSTLLVNYCLIVLTTGVLCNILEYETLDQFLMQSALAGLFLMLLEGVAAQHVFGADLMMTLREAQVGMPMVAYFVAKDLSALVEVTLSSAIFTATYSATSGCLMPLKQLFAGSWAFVYAVFGLNYVFSIILSPASAQMCAVVAAVMSFCTSGVYQPQLSDMAGYFNDRGWMIPALSPVRWLWGYLLTNEVPHLTELSRTGAEGSLREKGYDLKFLHQCTGSMVGVTDTTVLSLHQAWLENRGWVCSTAPLILLGVIFRFLAACCLLMSVGAQTSGWARFFGHSEIGAWKLAGNLFALLIGTFFAMFLFAEIWVFGIMRLQDGTVHGLVPEAGATSFLGLFEW